MRLEPGTCESLKEVEDYLGYLVGHECSRPVKDKVMRLLQSQTKKHPVQRV